MLGAMGTWAIGGLLVVAAAIATLMNWRRSRAWARRAAAIRTAT